MEKSVRRTIAAAEWWWLGQDLVAGADLDCWYKTGIRWIGGSWFRTGICRCRKAFAGPELVVAGICWSRKVVTGSGLLSLVRNWQLLVSAGAGKWKLESDGAGKWTLVSAGAGRRSLVQNWLLLVSAGAGKWALVSAGAGRWSLVQEGGRWCMTRSCWCLLVQEGSRWYRTGSCWRRTGSYFCREVAAGEGVVVAAAVRWSPLQEW